jgi:hypothetical protein
MNDNHKLILKEFQEMKSNLVGSIRRKTMDQIKRKVWTIIMSRIIEFVIGLNVQNINNLFESKLRKAKSDGQHLQKNN